MHHLAVSISAVSDLVAVFLNLTASKTKPEYHGRGLKANAFKRMLTAPGAVRGLVASYANDIVIRNWR